MFSLSRRSPARAGFTLVELLVVIAIIGVLVALLLPAVQSAREASRRMKCSNNLRQWAIAMHNMHDIRGQFPFGATNDTHVNKRKTWIMFVWPFIEQNNLADRTVANIPFYDPPHTVYNTMNGLCGQRLAIYRCPSDMSGTVDQNVGMYQRTRGNYMVNWGNALYDDTSATGTANINNWGPFYHIGGNRATPGTVNMRNITDGTSNTLLLSESLMAKVATDNDWRGDIHNDDGIFRFHTNLTPNSSAADLISSTTFFTANNDRLMPVALGNPQRNAARSRHPSGVMAALCDGSVRSFSNNVALVSWSAMGSMAGGEAVSAD